MCYNNFFLWCGVLCLLYYSSSASAYSKYHYSNYFYYKLYEKQKLKFTNYHNNCNQPSEHTDTVHYFQSTQTPSPEKRWPNPNTIFDIVNKCSDYRSSWFRSVSCWNCSWIFRWTGFAIKWLHFCRLGRGGRGCREGYLELKPIGSWWFGAKSSNSVLQIEIFASLSF